MILRIRKVHLKDLAISALVIAAFFSDIFFYFGLSVLTKVLFLFCFAILLISSKARDFYLVIAFLILLCICFFIGFLLEHQSLDYFVFPLLIVMGFLLSKGGFEPNRYKTFFIFFLLINGLALVYEKLNGSYLMDAGHPYSIIQGQGLFTWTKVQGEFLIGVALLASKDRFVLLVIFFSALLAGVRAATLMTVLLLILTLFNPDTKTYRLFNRYSLVFFVVSTIFLIPVFQQTLTDFNIQRYTGMLNFNSSTYSVRSYVHDLHYGCIGDYSFSQALFGRGRYCADLFSWGAESTIIHSVEYYGLILSFFLVTSLIYVVMKNIHWLKSQKVVILLMLLVYLWNWRFGFTYMGIFLWWFIFRAAKKTY